MSKLIGFFALLLLFPGYIFSQSLLGKIVDEKEQAPIAYANIGVLNKAIGTISKEDGHFEFDHDQLEQEDTLRISAIGFETRNLKREDLLDLLKKDGVIVLRRQIIPVEEVVVRSSKLKAKVSGNQSNSKIAQTGARINQAGVELAAYLPVKRKALLKSVHFNLASVPADTVSFRVKIYEVTKGGPGRLLSRQDILLRHKLEKGPNVFDLLDLDIVLKDHVFISYELIEGDGPAFSASLTARKSYYRPASQANWEKLPAGIALYCTLLYGR